MSFTQTAVSTFHVIELSSPALVHELNVFGAAMTFRFAARVTSEPLRRFVTAARSQYVFGPCFQLSEANKLRSEPWLWTGAEHMNDRRIVCGSI